MHWIPKTDKYNKQISHWQHIAFTQRCRWYKLTLCSLAVKHFVPTREGCQVATKASHQFLMAHIQQCYGKLRRLETDRFFKKYQLEYVVSPQHFAIIEEHKEQVKAKMSSSCKERQKRKFDTLLARCDSSNDLMTAMLWTSHWTISALLNCRPCPKVWTLRLVLSSFPRLTLWLVLKLPLPEQ